jgi:iron complex outermembrane receptor protein
MKVKQSPIAAAVSMTLLSITLAAQAQQAETKPAAKQDTAQLEAVVVTGIRASQEKSLSVKRNSDAHVDVITAEDIGKMPDKNVADSLARIPGVNASNAVAGEGGFDERDRVGLRGTNPSLTQTLVNGHSIANGDWFVLSQTGAGVGRSVSFSLLPSEVVGKVIVRKSSEASLPEGGTAGSVDIITRKPLEFKKGITAEAGIGGVYSDLAEKTDPQLSALFNFKSEDNTFGLMVQAFSEKRHLRRDGVETLSYSQIAADSAVAKKDPALAGVWVPKSIGAALFTQERKREGGLIAAEFKPTKDIDLVLTGFKSKMDAVNYNNNVLLMVGDRIIAGGQAPEAGYTISTKNGIKTLTSATFAPNAAIASGETDPISRPGSSAESQFVNFEGSWKVSDKLNLLGQIGTSTGKGKTLSQDVLQLDKPGQGGSYSFNGTGSAPAFSIGPKGSDQNKGWVYGWSWGGQGIVVTDKEDWLNLDGEYAMNMGVLQALKFGVRQAKHERYTGQNIGQGPACSDTHVVDWTGTYNCKNDAASPFNPANLPAFGDKYPSNFGSGLGSGFPSGLAMFTPAQLAEHNAKFTRRDLPGRRDWTSEYSVEEETTAGYLQGQLEGQGWSGNVGLRAVRTKSTAGYNVPGAVGAPGLIDTSAFGPFVPTTTERTYTDYLPSASVRFELNRDMILRTSVSRTMTRADYTALAGQVNLVPPKVMGEVGSGDSGNPNLNPVRSNNFDLNYEWYFAPRAFASAGVFYMDIGSYVATGQVKAQYITNKPNSQETYLATYLLNAPVNISAKAKGLELAGEMPVAGNFGLNSNYTYSDSEDSTGRPMTGASKHTFNLGGFFENDAFSARLNYGYRSEMYIGLDRGQPFYQLPGATVSASLGYKLNDNIGFSFDAQNLNNPTLKYRGASEDQPRSIYTNGRQYYLTARIKY